MIRLNTQQAKPLLTNLEISQMASTVDSFQDALEDIVTLLGNRLEVDVCSIYLLESDRTSIVLAATVGLNKNCVGTLRMRLDEGLAGLVADQLRPITVEEAARHPRFKYFPEAEEEAYQSFLGVPINDQGVLVVQTIEPCRYTPQDILELSNTANRLGRFVSEVRQRQIQ